MYVELCYWHNGQHAFYQLGGYNDYAILWWSVLCDFCLTTSSGSYRICFSFVWLTVLAWSTYVFDEWFSFALLIAAQFPNNSNRACQRSSLVTIRRFKGTAPLACNDIHFSASENPHKVQKTKQQWNNSTETQLANGNAIGLPSTF